MFLQCNVCFLKKGYFFLGNHVCFLINDIYFWESCFFLKLGGGFFNVFCFFFPQIALAFWGFLLTIGRGGWAPTLADLTKGGGLFFIYFFYIFFFWEKGINTHMLMLMLVG